MFKDRNQSKIICIAMLMLLFITFLINDFVMAENSVKKTIPLDSIKQTIIGLGGVIDSN